MYLTVPTGIRVYLSDTSAAKKLQDPFKHTGKEKYYDTQLRAVASRPFPYGNFPNAGQTYDEWMKAFFAHTIAVHNVRLWHT